MEVEKRGNREERRRMSENIIYTDLNFPAVAGLGSRLVKDNDTQAGRSILGVLCTVPGSHFVKKQVLWRDRTTVTERKGRKEGRGP